MLLDKRIQDKKSLLAGRKALLCDKGRNGGCDERCSELNVEDKCGYHKRSSIQNYLWSEHGILGYILDDTIDSSEPIIEREKEVVKAEGIEAILIFPDGYGSQIEFLDFSHDKELAGKILLLVKEEFFPYGSNAEGVLTSKIREFIMKGGRTIPVRKGVDLYKLITDVLLDYFRYN